MRIYTCHIAGHVPDVGQIPSETVSRRKLHVQRNLQRNPDADFFLYLHGGLELLINESLRFIPWNQTENCKYAQNKLKVIRLPCVIEESAETSYYPTSIAIIFSIVLVYIDSIICFSASASVMLRNTTNQVYIFRVYYVLLPLINSQYLIINPKKYEVQGSIFYNILTGVPYFHFQSNC